MGYAKTAVEQPKASTVACKTCGKNLSVGSWPYCPHGEIAMTNRVRTNRKFWTGEEVYGKKLEQRSHDTEQQMKERAKKKRSGIRASAYEPA